MELQALRLEWQAEKVGVTRMKKSDGVNRSLYACCYRGKQSSVMDITVPELFCMLYLLIDWFPLTYNIRFYLFQSQKVNTSHSCSPFCDIHHTGIKIFH